MPGADEPRAMGQPEQEPFPGLRPFEQDDSPFFFGRETQINELILRLGQHRFVAVVGESGSGKSSLVRAGLIPRLKNGFLHQAGEQWRPLIFEATNSPLKMLAGKLCSELWDHEASSDFLEYTLRMSDQGLVECVRGALGNKSGENLLLVVDQFEEIFAVDKSRPANLDSAAFVSLLLEAAAAPNPKIYVLLTMRSSHLGQCQNFPGLAEMMNRAQFLVPRMSREELRLAITAPPRVQGDEVAPALVEALLNEIGNDQDQLPVLQHALARTWEFWSNRPRHGSIIESSDYQRTGGLAGAIDQHAEQVYEKLSPRQAAVAAKLFQTITVERANEDLSRRPTTVAEIVRIASGREELVSVTAEEVIEVVNYFREGSNFLRPYVKFERELTPDSPINISHESLTWKWQRMRKWIADEHRTAHVYREVVGYAKERKDRLWDGGRSQDPELKAALARLEDQGWNEAWALQYGTSDEYHRATEFMELYRVESEKISRQMQLKQFLEQWTKLSLIQESEKIYQAACDIAVDLLKADRSTFVKFDETLAFGIVKAERTHPEMARDAAALSAIDLKIPLDDPHENALLNRKPIRFYDVEQEVAEGPFKANLRRLGVKSVLIVPVVGRSLVGSFSLDSVRDYRHFDEGALELCQLLAAQIAAALDNARALQEERRRIELMGKVDKYRDELGLIRDDTRLREGVLVHALDLCGWSAGALYRHRPVPDALNRLVFEDRRDSGWEPPLQITEQSEPWLWRFLSEKDGPSYQIVDAPSLQRELFRGHTYAVAIKVKAFHELDSVLLVMDVSMRPGSEMDILYLVQFTSRAAAALERQGVVDSVQEHLNLEFLHLLEPGPNTDAELRLTLHTFLTLVTASFGFSFNRAILFLLNDRADTLVTRMAIGQRARRDWVEACDLEKEEKRTTLDQWRYTATNWTPTPLEDWAMERHEFPLAGGESGVLSEIVETARGRTLRDWSQWQHLPKSILDLLQPASPVVLAPLHSGREFIGVLMVDKEFTRHDIHERDILALQVFCKQVALIIRDYVRPAPIPTALHALFEEINRIASDRPSELDEDAVLRAIARTTCTVFEASAVRIELMNFDRTLRVRITEPEGVLPDGWSPGDAATARVLQTGIAEIDEDLSASEWAPEIKLARCLPLAVENEPVGVLWILHHSRVGVRRVDPATLQRYAAEAGMAYANWQQMRALSTQRRALREIAVATTFEAAATQIVKSAQGIFGAKTVTFWPYDVRKQSFEDSVPIFLGFEEDLPKPQIGGTTYRLLRERGHVFVDDVEQYEGFQEEHGSKTLGFLRRNGVKSSEGVAIYSADEPLGVLFLGYGRIWPFGLPDKRALIDWATSVATTLKSVQLLETEREVHAAAEEAAGYLAKGSLELTLRKLASAARKVLRCGTVTIHQYDHEKREPISTPVSDGVRDTARMEREDQEDARRLIPALIRRGPLTIALNPHDVRELFASRFTIAENIQASFALRLEFAARYVGLMFFSFRNELQQHAADSLLDQARLFAKHASVAIGTSQRSEELTKLSAVLLAGEPGILNEALESVEKYLRPKRCNIVIREGRQLRSVAQRHWDDEHQEQVEETSHAGFTMAQRRPIAFSNIDDIAKDPLLEGFKPPERLRTAGMRSGLAVPILRGDVAEGAILVHDSEEREFSAEEISFMRIVANQLMMAYQGAQRVRAIKAESTAASLIASGSFENERVLLDKMLGVIREYVTDETGQPKIAEVRITLRGDRQAAGPNGFRQEIHSGRDHVGDIWGTTLKDRTLNAEDREILQNIAALTGIALRQMRDHRDSTLTLASLADSLVGQLKRMRTRLAEIQSNVERHSPGFHIEGLSGEEATLERLEDLNRRIGHTVRALEDPARAKIRRTRADELADLIRDVYEQELPEAIRENIEFRGASAKLSDREVRIDDTMIAAVLGNLTANAILLTPPAGWIECRAFEEEAGVVVEIQDSGRGLTEEERAQMFSQFDRAAPGKAHTGVKIGLANCRRVMELHGGRIDVSSEGPGRGSTFSIRIPWANESAAS